MLCAILGSRALRGNVLKPALPLHTMRSQCCTSGWGVGVLPAPARECALRRGATFLALVLLFKTFGSGSLVLQLLSSGSLCNRLGVPPKSWFNISFLDCFLGGLNRDWTLGEVTAFVKCAFFHNRRSLFGSGLVFPHRRIPWVGSVWPCVRWSLRATTHFGFWKGLPYPVRLLGLSLCLCLGIGGGAP